MGFKDEVDTAARSMGGGGDWYKFVEGDNKVRLLTEPVIKVSRFGYGICYEGAPYCQKATLDRELDEAKQKAKAAGDKDWAKATIKMPGKKWCAWGIVRGNKEKDVEDVMAIIELPYGVSKELRTMMDSDEAGFKGWPMPYDINVKAKGAGKLTVEYTVIADRQNKDVTPEELAELEKCTPVTQILDRMKDKQRQKVEGGGAAVASGPVEYPTEDINPDDIPF